MKQFELKLKEFRTQNKLTQEELGKTIHTTKQQFQLYESEQRDIKAIQLKEICKTYNISADYLLGLIDEPKPLK